MKFADFDVCKKFVNKDKLKIINYIQACYDKESPLNSLQNLKERKIAACHQAKLNPKDSDIKKIMEMRNKEVNDLIFTFLSVYQNSNSYHQLCSDQQLFWSIQQILMTPIDITEEDVLMDRYKKRGSLSETADGLKARINRLYSELYFSEDVKEVAQTKIRQMYRPEQRIKMKEEA